MTIEQQQQAIREATARQLYHTSQSSLLSWEETSFRDSWREAADEFLKELTERGVGLILDTEPHETKRDDGEEKYYGDMPGEMYDDGWRLTAPLSAKK